MGYSGNIPKDIGNLSLKFRREEDLIPAMVGKLFWANCSAENN